MALTQRGRVVIGGIAAVAVAGLATLAFTGNAPGPLQDIVDAVTDRPEPCPLTGELRAGGRDAPPRPMIAVKIENSDDAFPLAGLERADVIYEEPVEGGITRFAALFQCRNAGRAGPVRSARTTDPKILVPYADAPLLAYSGANPRVAEGIEDAGLVSLTETTATEAYVRDESRSAPHNLFVSLGSLHREARRLGGDDALPEPPFVFDEAVPTPSRPRTSATVAFSSSNVVGWSWTDDTWVRELDGEPMRSESGGTIAVDNVVIQEVVVTDSDIVDVAGFPSPEVDLLGQGRAWVLRDGRLVIGRWRRDSLDQHTIFETRGGEQIPLAPGTTFVQLVPKDDGEVTFAR